MSDDVIIGPNRCNECGGEYGDHAKDCSSFAAPTGSAAGSIIHTFRTELTRQQAKELKAIWSEHGKNGGMILMQPVLNLGVFDLKNCFLQAAVLDDECRKKIFAVIESAKRQNCD